MKKQLLYLLASALTLTTPIACDNDEPVELSVDNPLMGVPRTGGERTFTINANGKWTTAKTTSWMTIEPETGAGRQTITITVKENPYYDLRIGRIYITSINKTTTVTIQQEARELLPPTAAGTITGNNANNCASDDEKYAVQLSITSIPETDRYEWMLNGTPIPGATGISYRATESGSYTVAGVNAAGTGTPSPVKTVTITECPPDFGYGKTYSTLKVEKAALNTTAGNSMIDPFLTLYDNTAAALLAAVGYTNRYQLLYFTIKAIADNKMELTYTYYHMVNFTTSNVTFTFKMNTDQDGNTYFSDMTSVSGNASTYTVIFGRATANNLLKYLLYSGTSTISLAADGTVLATVQPSGNKFRIDWAPNNTPGLSGRLIGFYVVGNPASYIPGVPGN
ncbi:MAG: BACON domain-containing protein [Prevotellaceae bacterium]|jgi:hypothetical protein|nr:BACON domain-containing protein [Prevotellaceae bacterium]